MDVPARITDSIAALNTCRTIADLRDVWGNVYRHWSGAVPKRVLNEKERLKKLLTNATKKKETA